MKKRLLLILTAALIFSLCACSKDHIEIDPEPTAVNTAALRGEFDAACAYVESAADVSKMEATLQDDENGLFRYWNGTSEEYDEIGLDFKLEDNVFTLGTTTVSELTALGYKPDTDIETVEPNTVLGFSITKGDKFCNLAVDNSTDQPQKFSDMPITQFNGTSPENGCLPFTYSGIICGSTLKEVLDALGTPKLNITVSTDTAGTEIGLNYLNATTKGDLDSTDTLEIYLRYDKDKDTALVTSIILNRVVGGV